MKFQVSGALKQTGEDVSVTVEAGDYRTAEAKANAMGIVVSQVAPDNAHSDSGAVSVSLETQTSTVQTIEATGKLWKLCILLGIVLLLIGVIAIVLSFDVDSVSWLQWVARGLFLLGLLLYIAGRIGKWWYHE